MSIEKVRAEVIDSINRAIDESHVDLSSLSSAQRQDLAESVADRVMLTVDSILDEGVQETDSDLVDDKDEELLWQGRPFLSLVERYMVTSERLKLISGLLSRGVENFELIRVQDIDYKQGLHERMLGIGDITIQGQDASKPKIVLRNISNPEEVYEILRRAWLDARKRHGLEFHEFM